MRTRKTTRAFVTAAGLGLIAAAAALVSGCRSSPVVAHRETDAVTFPTVSGRNLLDEKIQFPDDIKGSPALLYVAFFQRQQLEVNTWLNQMDEIERALPGVRVLELPVISSVKWGWMAGFIDSGMRSGIPDPAARARTVTLYTDTRAFRDALGLPDNQRIYAVLTDADGRVVSVQEGPFDPGKLRALAEAFRPAG